MRCCVMVAFIAAKHRARANIDAANAERLMEDLTKLHFTADAREHADEADMTGVGSWP